jgi:hypothetical protein
MIDIPYHDMINSDVPPTLVPLFYGRAMQTRAGVGEARLVSKFVRGRLGHLVSQVTLVS